MKIAVILGTRPEIIKMTAVTRGLENRQGNYFILHTGQYYWYNLDEVFFEELKLTQARYNLEVGSGSHAEQTAKILIGEMGSASVIEAVSEQASQKDIDPFGSIHATMDYQRHLANVLTTRVLKQAFSRASKK